jgi:hypothetical protein
VGVPSHARQGPINAPKAVGQIVFGQPSAHEIAITTARVHAFVDQG